MKRALASPGETGQWPHALARLAPVNGLRGIAIIAVVYCHLVAGLWTAAEVPLWVSPLLTNGWTGVNLFFVLSGFVLYLPYAAGDRPMRTVSDRVSFYRRRALRLLPLFYVAVVIQWALALRSSSGPGFGELFAVLSLDFIIDSQNFGPSFNMTLWSIGVEIAFSALFPLLVLGCRSVGMARFVLLMLALALAARLIGLLRNPAVEAATFDVDFFVCRADEFVIGMMVAQLYIGHRLPRHPGICMFGGVALVLVAWLGFDLTLRHILPTLFRAALSDVLDAGLCLVLLAALVPGTRLATAASARHDVLQPLYLALAVARLGDARPRPPASIRICRPADRIPRAGHGGRGPELSLHRIRTGECLAVAVPGRQAASPRHLDPSPRRAIIEPRLYGARQQFAKCARTAVRFDR